MHSRKASVAPAVGSTKEKDLESALVKEQTARIAAEHKVKEVTSEIEELSESLFQQANEMVATERRENAQLKQKIADLEEQKKVLEEQRIEQQQEHAAAMAQSQEVFTGVASTAGVSLENAKLREKVKMLEQRDAERRKRLDRIEAAHKRIERVRSMLVPR